MMGNCLILGVPEESWQYRNALIGPMYIVRMRRYQSSQVCRRLRHLPGLRAHASPWLQAPSSVIVHASEDKSNKVCRSGGALR